MGLFSIITVVHITLSRAEEMEISHLLLIEHTRNMAAQQHLPKARSLYNLVFLPNFVLGRHQMNG